MRKTIESIEGEYRRYRSLAADAIAQLDDQQLAAPAPNGGNSIAVIAWHIGGNLRSRFTDFLTSDGEKPWRDREEEFAERHVTRADVMEKLEVGWRVLFDALSGLDDGHLHRDVTIRGVALTVAEALHRSLAHTSYHTGQIVVWAKALRGSDWRYLSIPPGKTDEYRKNPTRERPPSGR